MMTDEQERVFKLWAVRYRLQGGKRHTIEQWRAAANKQPAMSNTEFTALLTLMPGDHHKDMGFVRAAFNLRPVIHEGGVTSKVTD